MNHHHKKNEINEAPVEPIIEKEFQDYKQFAFNKNMMVVAISLIMATAFQKTVTGIADFIIMPIINYFINQANIGDNSVNWRDMVIHPVAGMNIELGHMIAALIDFLVLTFVLFIIWKVVVIRLWPDAQLTPATPTTPIKPVEKKKK